MLAIWYFRVFSEFGVKKIKIGEYFVIVVVVVSVGFSTRKFRKVAESYFENSFKDVEGRNLLFFDIVFDC